MTTIANQFTLWFGRILLLFQRSDLKHKMKKQKKHSRIEMQTKLRICLSLSFTVSHACQSSTIKTSISFDTVEKNAS